MDNHNMGVPPGTDHGNLKFYVIGFLASIFFTLLSYLAVVYELFSSSALVGLISVSAVLQALVQLVLFLHLGSESKPRWNLMVFLFMALVLMVIVFGSLWIMYNLDYRML